MNKTKLTLGLVLLGVVILFTLQNAQVVDVWFLFWKVSMSRVLLVFMLLVVGGLLGWLACSASHRRGQR